LAHGASVVIAGPAEDAGAEESAASEPCPAPDEETGAAVTAGPAEDADALLTAGPADDPGAGMRLRARRWNSEAQHRLARHGSTRHDAKRPHPTCPAVLRLVYYREGWRHEVFLAFDIQGNSVVSLDTGWQWSGWHGFWDGWVYGGLVVWMHYTGDRHRAWPHFFDRVWYRGHIVRMYGLHQGYNIRVLADMVTWLDRRPALSMTSAAQWVNPLEWLELNRPWRPPSEIAMAAIAASEQP